MKHGVVSGAEPLSPAGRQVIKEIIHSYLESVLGKGGFGAGLAGAPIL